jgi:isoleucyl-tRNA synthetase
MYTEKILDSRFKIQDSKNILDKWILIRLNQLIGEVSAALDKYELNTASRPIGDFIDDLSNWYVRRSRERFKEGNPSFAKASAGREDKESAMATLNFVLIELSKIIAPFMPFIAEEIYQDVKCQVLSIKGQGSVHLEDWPQQKELRIMNNELRIIEDMSEARKIASIALEERQKAGIKVRQPLSELKIKNLELRIKEEFLDLIKDEINVKEIIFDKNIANDIELDTKITPELKNEGMTRELIRGIQDLRKKSGLNPQDKISLVIETDEMGEKFIKDFENEIKKGTNSAEIKFVKIEGKETKPRTELDSGAWVKIDELEFKIEIKK